MYKRKNVNKANSLCKSKWKYALVASFIGANSVKLANEQAIINW